MKKILIICSSLHGGGAEHVARKNFEILNVNTNINVGVVTCDGYSTENPFHYRLKDFRNTESFYKKMKATLSQKFNFEDTQNILLDFKPDIIHLHDFVPFGVGLLNAIQNYKERFFCKVIMTHHTYSYICTNDSLYNYNKDMLCEKCIGTYNTRIVRDNCANSMSVSIAKWLQKNRLKKHYNNLIDLHISPSNFLLDKLSAAKINGDKIAIRNPCIENVDGNNENNTKKEIVYFGRISKEKNIIDFIKAFSRLSTDFSLHIIGTGPEEKELSELIEKLNNKDIKFTNIFLKTEDLYNEIKTSYAFLLPSIWYENSPVSIVEAINWGMVPIVSNIGGMKELIDLFGIGKTFAPTSENEILEAINYLETTYNNRKDYSDEKTINKLNQFTTENYAREILKIYMNI